MAGPDKRAKLLSDLLASKGGATGDGSRSAAPERSPVIHIADRRASDDRPAEAPASPAVLYSKGTATASTFRPSYWSFGPEQQGGPSVAPGQAEPPLRVPTVAETPTRKSLPVNVVVGFGCLALAVSTTLFVISLWHRVEAPAVQSEPATIAAAPTPVASVVPFPLPPQDQPVAVPAAPAQAAATPPPAVFAPTPIPPAVSVPAPAASDPAPAAVVAAPGVGTPAEPPPTIAAAPAANPNPEADALLARGDSLLATGDVAAARLFYQRAAEQGSAAAATAVGQTYDPAVLDLLRVRGVRGDSRLAAEWYRKAIAAGDQQAEIRLKRLLARTPG